MKKYFATALILVIGFFAIAQILKPNYAKFLPNLIQTPGAIDPNVTQNNIQSTICVLGYTKTVRPPVTYTSPLKRAQLDNGYNLNGDTKMQDYEEDHLIPLEVGGSPTSEKNLWPEYLYGQYGAHVKDNLENEMHYLVCHGKVSLAQAQAAFTPDWVAGYKKYLGALPATATGNSD